MSVTKYVVFRMRANMWEFLGVREARTPGLACKAQAFEDDEDGAYAAVPESAWRPAQYTLVATKSVVVGP